MGKCQNRPYHKRWHGDALQGYRKLSLELRGAYTTLLDVMYDHGGPVEERFVCAWLGCDIRVWKRIRRELVDEYQKLHVFTDSDGAAWLVNERVQRELGLPTYAELVANLPPKLPIATQELTPKSAEKHSEINEPKPVEITKSAALLPLPLPEDSVPAERAPSAGPEDEFLKEAWDLAIKVLMELGSMSRKQAGSFFGGLLRDFGLQPRDMLPSLTKAWIDRTRDPASYLRAAAKRIAKDRGGGVRAAAPDPGDWGDPEWSVAMAMWRESGLWGPEMGPEPGEVGCKVPRHLLIMNTDHPARLAG